MLNLLFRRTRHVAAAEDFSFVAVGYPKVGNTWLRVALGRYVQRLSNLADLPLFEPGDSERLSRGVGPAAAGYFTHAPLEWTKQTARDLTEDAVVGPFRDKTVILLVRHPLDAVVSHYMHKSSKLDENTRFSGSLLEFIEDEVFGLNKLLRYYEHWREGRSHVNRFLLWRYEDARSEPMESLRKVVNFLSLPMDVDAASDAIQFSSFENMKSIESSGARFVYKSSGFDVFGGGDRSNPDAFHVRNGKVGGYRSMFPTDRLEEYERVVTERLSLFYGY